MIKIFTSANNYTRLENEYNQWAEDKIVYSSQFTCFTTGKDNNCINYILYVTYCDKKTYFSGVK